MNRRYLTLAGRIENELTDIEKIVKRALESWEKAENTSDDLYIDSVALNLHSFYSALERIFELIAVEIDEMKPEGDSWHLKLLRQMGINIKYVRPAVLSKATIHELDEYRGFRHIVRNVYTYNLSKNKMKPLVENSTTLFKEVKSELEIFLEFIYENMK